MAERPHFEFGDGTSPLAGGSSETIDAALGATSLGGDDGGLSGGDNGGGGGSGDDRTFDAARHISINHRNADGSYTRKRRRRGSGGGSTSRTSPANNSASVDALTQMLVVVHAGLASLTKIDELAIEESEGKSLATAIANALHEFGVPIDPKTQALVNLVVSGGMIYGPRMYLYNERMKQQKKERQHGPTVVQMVPEGFQPAS